MGACTAVIKKKNVRAYGRSVIADVTLSASYATGGDTAAISLFKIGKRLSAIYILSNAGGYNLQVVYGATEFTDPLIKVYQGDNANAAAAPGIEVPNATDLHLITFRVEAFGSPYK